MRQRDTETIFPNKLCPNCFESRVLAQSSKSRNFTGLTLKLKQWEHKKCGGVHIDPPPPFKTGNNSDFWPTLGFWAIGPKSPKTPILTQKSLLLMILEGDEYVHTPNAPNGWSAIISFLLILIFLAKKLQILFQILNQRNFRHFLLYISWGCRI